MESFSLILSRSQEFINRGQQSPLLIERQGLNLFDASLYLEAGLFAGGLLRLGMQQVIEAHTKGQSKTHGHFRREQVPVGLVGGDQHLGDADLFSELNLRKAGLFPQAGQSFAQALSAKIQGWFFALCATSTSGSARSASHSRPIWIGFEMSAYCLVREALAMSS